MMSSRLIIVDSVSWPAGWEEGREYPGNVHIIIGKLLDLLEK